jgi:hypothetical protein
VDGGVLGGVSSLLHAAIANVTKPRAKAETKKRRFIEKAS